MCILPGEQWGEHISTLKLILLYVITNALTHVAVVSIIIIELALLQWICIIRTKWCNYQNWASNSIKLHLEASTATIGNPSEKTWLTSQTNPLIQIVHGRKLRYLGPGGLVRRTASFGVRNIHPSYNGHICPIDTFEGINVGLLDPYQFMWGLVTVLCTFVGHCNQM